MPKEEPHVSCNCYDLEMFGAGCFADELVVAIDL